MPSIRTSRTRAPPEGYEDIADMLDEYERKMREAEAASHEGKRKTESVWPILQLAHMRTRYVFDLYYKREAISRELYDWLIKERYADAKCVLFPIFFFFRCHAEQDGLLTLVCVYGMGSLSMHGAQLDGEVEAPGVREAVLCALHPSTGQQL